MKIGGRMAMVFAALSSLSLLILFPTLAQAAAPEGALAFTASQAASGRTLYVQYCAPCHGAQLEGGEAGPALRGRAFMTKWIGKPIGELFELTRRTMPVAQPGGLARSQYADLLAYVMRDNGYPAGAVTFPPDEARLAQVLAPPPVGGGPTPELTAVAVVGDAPLAADTEWLHHRGDAGSMNYAPLDFIHRGNVSKLRVAWRWRSDNFGSAIWPNLQSTPLMANGVLYATVGASRSVVAIDARTGETLWMFRMDEGARGSAAPRKGPGRGVALWRRTTGAVGSGATSAQSDVIFYITPGYQLIALEAKSGQPVEAFGNGGIVDLRRELDQTLDVDSAPIGASSPPIVVGDVVIVGSAFPPGSAPPRREMPVGHVMGFDVRTGTRRWIFHTIPRRGERGHETWKNGSDAYTGNTGVWAPISADIERGLVYLPVEAPTSDFYGGHRHGDNLYSSSLVCLDARTGERRWHFQHIHHDLWDYDTPAAPVLLDITVVGRRIPAVAQVTKQGFTFVFNRATGEPVWPIIERRVPRSHVPGEKSSATQPMPTLPEPFERQGVTPDDLNDLTPEIKAEALKIASRYRFGPLFAPPSVVTSESLGTLQMPGSQGGANWQGAVADPETGVMYVSTTSTITYMGLVSEPERSNLRYIMAGSRVAGPFGLPLSRPPWGSIVALDLNSGRRIWAVANGDTPEYVRNHDKLKGIVLPRTGHDDRAGLLVTRTLLFAGEGAGMYVATQGGTKFRAHDKLSGEILWETDLGLRQSGLPMTYVAGGKQYIVVPAGAPGRAGEFIALTPAE